MLSLGGNFDEDQDIWMVLKHLPTDCMLIAIGKVVTEQ